MHEVLVNRLGGISLPRKTVVRLTDRPDMTLDVYCGRKTTMQQQKQPRLTAMVMSGRSVNITTLLLDRQGCSGGAMVLGKLPVPGRPTKLDNSRARAYCACSTCEWVVWTLFSLIYHFLFLSPSLWEAAQYRLQYCLKGPLNQKQPT